MSCPHLKYSIINKSNGGSIIASSAYDRREKMFDELENRMKYPHTKSDDHVLTKMLLPKDSPASYTDPYRIWNDLNKIESDKIGYKLIIPFQRELSFNQNLELAIELLNEEYVSKGHPVQIDVHRGKNNNYHLHAIAADRRLINGEWENQKTETVYYKRGTVKKLDSRGKVINPDAVKLTNADKINTPKLKGKKLQYDKNNNVIMEKGWQELQYNSNGKPLLDENGYPVLVDIREPYYIQEEGSTEYSTKEIKYSKNGKYIKPQFKKDTVKHSDVSDIGNINRIRMTWERLQNEYYKKCNVRDEDGKIFTVDLRSYKEQNKVRPADQQMIPTKHIGYGMKSESVLNYNDDAKKHNELVKEIQMKARALKAEQDKLARTEKARAAMLQENEKFYALLNPRQAFINSWTSQYNELVSQRNSFETTVLQKLEAGQKFNADHRKQIDRKTRRGNASWNRLERHSQLMSKVSADIQSVTGSTFDIATLAGKKFDALSNKEIVAFIRARYGYKVSTIAADVLERNHKDNSNAISGRKDKPPYYPKANTNEIKLQQSVNAITADKQDLAAVTATALSTWDKAQDEAPPKNIMNVLDSYYTAEQFYNTNLSGHEWNVVHLDPSYNPDAINRDYNDELKAIDVQEKEEAEARKAAEEEAKRKAAEEEAKRKAAEEEAKRKAAEEEAKRIKEANSPYTTERIRLNQIQINNLENLLDKIIEPMANKTYKEKRKKAIFSGNATAAPDLEQIKNELRTKFVDKNDKPTYARVVKAAQQMQLDISAVIATRDALKANYETWHDENKNLLDTPKDTTISTEQSQTNTTPQPTQKEDPIEVEIQHPTVKHSKSKLDNIAFEQQEDGSYKDVSIELRWKEKDDHEKNAMEKAEDEMSDGWDPGKNK